MSINKYIMKTEGNTVVAKKPITLIFEKKNFENGISTISDSTINTLGIFSIKTEDDKEFEVNYPLPVVINLYDIEIDNDKINVIYEENDIIIDEMMSILSVDDAIRFTNYFTQGKIVNKPDVVIKMFQDTMQLTGVGQEVPHEFEEAMLAEMMRYKENHNIPFRLAGKVKKDVKPDEFDIINIKDISRVTSVFSAISFEDVKKSLLASVLMTRKKIEQTPMPIDTVLRL